MSYDKRKSSRQDLTDYELENMTYGDLKRIARSMNIPTANTKRTDLINSIKWVRNARGANFQPDVQVLNQQMYNQQFPPLQPQPNQKSFQVQQAQGQKGFQCPEVGYQAPMYVPVLQPIPNTQCVPYKPAEQRLVQPPINAICYPEQPTLLAGQFVAKWPIIHHQQAACCTPLNSAPKALHAQYPNRPSPGYFHHAPFNGGLLINDQIVQHPNLSQQGRCGTDVGGLAPMFNCPIVDCNIPLPLFDLSRHILKTHAASVGRYFEWETRFIVTDFYEHQKMLHIQNLNNRMFLTSMDYVNGFLHVAVQHLPDCCNERTTAILQFKKQDHVVCNWEGCVPLYERLIPKVFCMVINLLHCEEREQLSIKTILL